MGQRHQIYVVARIRPAGGGPPAYRCVVALHDQVCYGTLPLKSARRFLALIKQRDNAAIVERELRNLDGKYEPKARLPKSPCAFLNFLTMTSWSTDLEDPTDAYAKLYMFPPLVLNCNMRPSYGDNNDGITVLDITDPTSPAYCFASVCGPPVSAEEYVSRYYPVPSPEELEDKRFKEEEDMLLKVIADLDGEKMVDFSTLIATWPSDYRKAKPNPLSVTENPEVLDVAASPDPSTELLSLADLSLNSAVLHAIATGETADLEDLLWLPGKADQVRVVLKKETPFPDTALSLLRKLVAIGWESKCFAEGTVDVSGMALTDDQLSQLVTEFADEVEALNISSNVTVTITGVCNVLTRGIKLKRLIVVDCPLITDADVNKLLQDQPNLFYNVESFIHPLFFQKFSPHRDTKLYTPAFTYFTTGFQEVPCCTLPFFNPTRVIDAFTRYLKCVAFADPLNSSDLAMSTLVPSSVFGAETLQPGERWGERRLSLIPQFSIRGLQGEGWVLASSVDVFRPERAKNSDSASKSRSSRDEWATSIQYAFVRFRRPVVTVPEQGGPDSSETQRVDDVGVDGVATADASDQPAPVRFVPPAFPDPIVESLHDVRSFAAQMALEGRPPVPESTIKEMENALGEGPNILKAFTQPELESYVSQVKILYITQYRMHLGEDE
ncbi:hypothetical protein BV22DRAFT_1065925 [Leucogyrophana mollusca]|uniref:Uncharacterized protein n=1 Tax=Leucogyrophana mollusca TaxID=85980 RepID=A0ACB8BGW4_9AGAM|nr:hypothetical protein BV22DRAFT_1065925 [Leucogyrophana mollusca]